MDDGLVLRADVFRPMAVGQMAGAPDLWSLRQGTRLSEGLPERLAGHDRQPSRRRLRLDQQIPELGSGRPREVGAAWLCLRPRRFARDRAVARVCRSFLATRDARLLPMHRVGRRPELVKRQGRAERRLLLRDQPVAGGLAAAAASEGDVHLGGCGRLVSRHDPPWRHPLDVLGQLVRHAGQDRAVWPRRTGAAQPGDRRAGLRRRDAVG